MSTIKGEEKNKDKDRAFNKLKDLQALLKKEASFRELFTKTSDETKKDIEDECKKIYQRACTGETHVKRCFGNLQHKSKLFKRAVFQI